MNGRTSEGTLSAQRVLRIVQINGRQCVHTGAVAIGCLHQPRPPVATKDGERLQEALLEPRTAQPASALARVAGALWSWA